MFNFGITEIILILGLALVIIGPKKLPGLARTIGKGLREFKKASNEFQDAIDIDPNYLDVHEDAYHHEKERQKDLEDREKQEDENQADKTGVEEPKHQEAQEAHSEKIHESEEGG